MAVTMSGHSASHAEEALLFFGKEGDPKPGEDGSRFPPPPNGSLFYTMNGEHAGWLYDASDRVWSRQNHPFNLAALAFPETT